MERATPYAQTLPSGGRDTSEPSERSGTSVLPLIRYGAPGPPPSGADEEAAMPYSEIWLRAGGDVMAARVAADGYVVDWALPDAV